MQIFFYQSCTPLDAEHRYVRGYQDMKARDGCNLWDQRSGLTSCG